MTLLDLNSPDASAALLRAIDERLAAALDKRSPQHHYGIVASVNAGARTASLYIKGSVVSSPGFVYSRRMVPTVGDLVRVVIDPTGDRYVDEVYALSGLGTANPREFGATGNGTTDDIAAFDAATASLAAVGGGIIYVPEGDYRISEDWTIDLDFVHVELNVNARIFNDGATFDGGTIAFVGYGYGLGEAIAPQKTWASIRGGTVENLNNGTMDNAIAFARYKNARVEGVNIPRCGRKAITAQFGVDNVHFVGNTIANAGLMGISVETECDSVWVEDNEIATIGTAEGIVVTVAVRDAWIARNRIASMGDGILISASTRAQVVDNIVSATGTGARGILALSAVGLRIDGNIIRETHSQPIYVNGCTESLQINGNAIHAVNAAANTVDAIYLEGLTCRYQVNDNYIAIANARYLINAVSSPNSGIAMGNYAEAPGQTANFGGWTPLAGLNLVAAKLVKAGSWADGPPWYGPVGPTQMNSSAVDLGLANRAMIWPFIARADKTVTAARFRVVTGGSGNFDVGLYDAALNRLGSSGSVAVPASGTTVARSIGSVTLEAGKLYYAAFVCSSTASKFEGYITPGASWVMGQGFYQRMESALPLPAIFVVGGTDDVNRAVALFYA